MLAIAQMIVQIRIAESNFQVNEFARRHVLAFEVELHVFGPFQNRSWERITQLLYLDSLLIFLNLCNIYSLQSVLPFLESLWIVLSIKKYPDLINS